MSATDLVLVVAAVLTVLAFCALVVVLVRVLDTLQRLRADVDAMRAETTPLLDALRTSTDDARRTVEAAREDLERFDRVLGSAEAIGDAVAGSGRVARTALSAPVIKAAGIATGTSRAVRRLRRQQAVQAGTVEVLPAATTRGRRRA